MRILFLSQILPYPLDSGVKIRTYFTLRQLTQQHEVTLACFVRDDNTPQEIAHLRRFCHEVHSAPMRRSLLKNVRFLLQSLLTNRSFIILRDTVPAMQRLVDALLDQAAGAGQPFEAIHCDQLWMAQYALRACGVKKVLDQHNAVYLIPKRLAQHEGNPLKRLFLEQEWRKLAHYEAEACRQFDHIVTVTAQDKQALEHLLPHEHPAMTVLPICVDPSSSHPVRRDVNSAAILHLGTMYWPPNVEGVLWFARQILPCVQERVPHARLRIVGKNPPRAVRDLEREALVEVTGYAADPEPYLVDCAAFIVPLHAGGGMRVKILDAWLWGVPIVSTSVGAEGIDVEPGRNILIADEPTSFADAVIRLLEDHELAQYLTANGRRWVEERYDWRSRYGALSDLYKRL